jgi:hypothetical protein
MEPTQDKRSAGPTRDKRSILVKIFVQGGVVMSELIGFNNEMLELDQHFSEELQDDQHQARSNREDRRAQQTLQAGQRVHADDYVEEPEYEHAGIHLFVDKDDEIIWYSECPIRFVVDIHRDPELIRLAEETSHNRPVEVGKNNGIDNLFKKPFPLISRHGEPVNSGPIRGDDAVLDQCYYKFTVTVDGINEPLDPHIAGHRPL